MRATYYCVHPFSPLKLSWMEIDNISYDNVSLWSIKPNRCDLHSASRDVPLWWSRNSRAALDVSLFLDWWPWEWMWWWWRPSWATRHASFQGSLLHWKWKFKETKKKTHNVQTFWNGNRTLKKPLSPMAWTRDRFQCRLLINKGNKCKC